MRGLLGVRGSGLDADVGAAVVSTESWAEGWAVGVRVRTGVLAALVSELCSAD